MFYWVCKSLVVLFYRIVYRMDIKGMENIPTSSGAILCPNHYFWADPLTASIALKRKPIIVTKQEAFKNKLGAFFLKQYGAVPIKRGETDIKAFKTILSSLKDNQLVMLFPEGTRMKNNHLGKANAGAFVFAHRAQVPIIPVAINGGYKWFSKLKVRYGTPIYLTEYYGKKLSDKDKEDLGIMLMSCIKKLIKEA